MWVAIRIAPNLVLAEQMKGVLISEGIPVELRPLSAPHLGASGPIELFVPLGKEGEANTILNGGTS